MAYRIEYGGGKQYPEPGAVWTGRMVLISMVLCVLFLETAYRFWPEGAEVLDRLRNYEGWFQARSALESIAVDLRNGIGFGEAVRVFCSEVIGQGLIHAA